MGRIVVHENVSVDGVMQDPTGDEGYASGGWFARMPADVFAAWGEVEYEEARECAAWLIGRGTYRWFAERWAEREGAWADRLREVPKYVLSSTMAEAPEWANSFVVKGDPASEAARLRAEVDGDVLVYGSRPLARALLEAGEVDELRLMTHPFVLGAGGERLFADQGAMRALELAGVREVGGRLALLTYRPA